MQLFQINAMNVSRDDFKRELEKNGLKYGYIPRLYEKFKQGEMTCFRLMIKDCQFVVVTDDESSYPENYLQMYIHVKKAEKNDEKIKQRKCPYCDEEMLDDEIGGEPIPESVKGYAIEHGDIIAFIAKENGKFYMRHDSTPDDG